VRRIRSTILANRRRCIARSLRGNVDLFQSLTPFITAQWDEILGHNASAIPEITPPPMLSSFREDQPTQLATLFDTGRSVSGRLSGQVRGLEAPSRWPRAATLQGREEHSRIYGCKSGRSIWTPFSEFHWRCPGEVRKSDMDATYDFVSLSHG
jgi:hypothetical protein